MTPTPTACLACAVLAFAPVVTSFVSGPPPVPPSRFSRVRRYSPPSPVILSRRPSTAHVRMVAAPERATAPAREVGSANMDWENLGFEYRDVNCHVKFTFKDGRWDEGEAVSDPYVKVHIANTALHYGQSVFEGLKAFHTKDGRCENWERGERGWSSRRRVGKGCRALQGQPACLSASLCVGGGVCSCGAGRGCRHSIIWILLRLLCISHVRTQLQYCCMIL